MYIFCSQFKYIEEKRIFFVPCKPYSNRSLLALRPLTLISLCLYEISDRCCLFVCVFVSLLFRVVIRFYNTTIALFITRQKVHKYEFSTNISVLLAIEPAAATGAVMLRSINDNRSNDKFNNTLA